jgi:hypothetical protein
VLAELLDEIARRHGLTADIDGRLARDAGLDARILGALGGDGFPASPMRALGSGR